MLSQWGTIHHDLIFWNLEHESMTLTHPVSSFTLVSLSNFCISHPMEYLNSLQTCHTTESGIFIVFQSVGPLLTWIGYLKKFNQAPSFLSLDIQDAFTFEFDGFSPSFMPQ